MSLCQRRPKATSGCLRAALRQERRDSVGRRGKPVSTGRASESVLEPLDG